MQQELVRRAPRTFSATGAAANVHEGETATLLTDGRVIVGDALGDTAEIWDPGTGSFSPAGSLATGQLVPSTATRLRDGRFLFIAGTDVSVIDPRTGTWTPTGSPAIDHPNGTTTVLSDGRVLVVGGRGERCQSQGVRGSEVERVETADLETAVMVCHPFGLASAELWDPTSGSFSAAGSLDWGRYDHTAVLLGDGRVLVVGGYDGLTSAEVFQLR